MSKYPTLNLETLLKAYSSDLHSPNGAGNGNSVQASREMITKAFALAEKAHLGQKRSSGEPYVQHCLAVANILTEFHLDAPTIAAALLHDTLEDTTVTRSELKTKFGEEVASLIEGVTKLGQFDQLDSKGERSYDERELESLRKMFLAMVDDPRVVLIKLADRLHNMRTLGALTEDRRERIAKETLELFAPLANRLGIWQMKWELEDLGFRYLYPDKYREIAALIDERLPNREDYIDEIIRKLQDKLKAEGIQSAEISGRPKHIYSIWKKMERKGGFDQVYDVRAVRVIVDTVAQCYAVLGIVHSMWQPIRGEFDDYIATPKDNFYQSLHTAVVADEGKTLEAQIRTHDMHRHAELGIAAHWRYKEGGKSDLKYEEKIKWFRQLMDFRSDISDAKEFVDSLRNDVFQDRVYVFTPKGKLIDLATASTPIDFAYQIHTDVGDRCRGARVNGSLVPLDYQLQTGDRVEILTAKRGGPSRDWLNPNLGYVKTERARTKIKVWFKKQDREANIAQGREILERELRRLSVEALPHDAVAKLFNLDKVDDFFEKIGSNDISSQAIVSKVIEADRKANPPEEEPVNFVAPSKLEVSDLTVRGTGGLLTTLATCCNPVPGDAIVGYVTRGRGVTVHKRNCVNIVHSSEAERLIEVSWGSKQRTYPVTIKITAYDRDGLLRDVAAVITGGSVNMSSVNVTTNKNIATFLATLEIAGTSQLSTVMDRIERLPNIIEVRR
ncbi:MAG TPA: bifunctional (p)ppGpp synthetase/guanosine-3',5'-bis(diphosphate) 3'-pyrophosphohydrolase, partial [Anaerolineae bacterium]|nr:bifunctional (p)ppGpp synthetase/guanosine-3',5'-bis(diphosphate) 3'-pyrophosphohydrolase [Anaerolineae bacterium]